MAAQTQVLRSFASNFFHVTERTFKKIKWICLKPRSDDDQDCVEQPELEDQVVDMDGKSVGGILTLGLSFESRKEKARLQESCEFDQDNCENIHKLHKVVWKNHRENKKRPTTHR